MQASIERTVTRTALRKKKTKVLCLKRYNATLNYVSTRMKNFGKGEYEKSQRQSKEGYVQQQILLLIL